MTDRDRFREFLEEGENDQGPPLDPATASDLEEALRNATDDAASADTLEILAFLLEPQGPRAEEEEARADARVTRAMEALRRGRQNAGKPLLRDARAARRLAVAELAEGLGVNAQTVGRIEQGQWGLLTNLDPERVAKYLGALNIDAMLLIRQVFPLRPPQAVHGYTPRVETDERETAQSDVRPRDFARDAEWIGQLLRFSGVPFG